MKSLLFLFLLCWGLANALPARAGQRALLVGIANYPEPEARLHAPLRDVERIAALLKKRFGFAEGDIVRLLDEQATKAGVLAAFQRQLIEGTGLDDVIVFYYSGHGSFVPDLDGDEADGQDEALCTFDIDGLKPESWLTDDDMQGLLLKVKARHVLVIYDSCHSGTGTRSAVIAPGAGARFRSKFMPLEFLSSKDGAALKRSGGMAAGNSPSNHIFLAACDAREEALELVDGKGGAYSAFTAFLSDTLEQASGDLNFTTLSGQVREAVQKAVTEVTGGRKKQTPQVEGRFLETNVTQYLGGAIVTAQNIPGQRSKPESAPVATPLSNAEIRIALATNGQRFQTGQLLTVSVKVDTDCHLRLYDYNAERQVVQIFPNQYQRNNFVRAGETVTLPGAGAPFQFEMGEPFGAGVLKAVASSCEFTDEAAARFEKEMFHSLGQLPLGELARRGINVKASAQTPLRRGEAHQIYRVDPAP